MNPTTARDIVLSLPARFKAEKAGDFRAIIHLCLEGEGGGNFTVTIAQGTCQVIEELTGTPDCVIRTKASVYEDTELGRSNPTMAVMMGKIKVSDIGVATQFIPLFDRVG